MASPTLTSTMRDMVLTLLVLAVPIVLITWFFQSAGQQEPQVAEQNWKAVVAEARSAGAMSISAPAEVPASWKATRARWTTRGQTGTDGQAVAGDTLELGFLTDDQMYVGQYQTNAPAAKAYITRVTRQGVEVDTVQAKGGPWKHYLSQDERTHSLVKQSGDVTLVLVSDAGVDRLTQYADLLATA